MGLPVLSVSFGVSTSDTGVKSFAPAAYIMIDGFGVTSAHRVTDPPGNALTALAEATTVACETVTFGSSDWAPMAPNNAPDVPNTVASVITVRIAEIVAATWTGRRSLVRLDLLPSQR